LRALIEYRPFRNTDAPQLAEVWRLQGPQRGLMQPMSMAVLERFVFAKPYFDPQGLIVATEAEKIVGFAHAGFGPSADEDALSTSEGVTCVVMLRPEIDRAVGQELLARCEAYLRRRGATALRGGACFPLAPFYYGLYGGSELSGVLTSDANMQAIFHESGYRELNRSVVMRCDLAQFRPTVDRQQMQIRRHHTIEIVADPPTRTWWEACMFEPFDRTMCFLIPRARGEPAAHVLFWSMETMLGTWGVRAAGIADVEVSAERQRQGLARFLLGEAFRHLHEHGVAVAEVHVPCENAPALSVFGGLGFEVVDEAVHYAKD
jgi:ribosomal protein S18 acetylase RimI-like enzyme